MILVSLNHSSFSLLTIRPDEIQRTLYELPYISPQGMNKVCIA